MVSYERVQSPCDARPQLFIMNYSERNIESGTSETDHPRKSLRFSAESSVPRKKSCWTKFKDFWKKPEDRTPEQRLQNALRKLVTYIIFLIIVSILAFSTMSPSLYYMTRTMNIVFVDADFNTSVGRSTFRESTTVLDFWGIHNDFRRHFVSCYGPFSSDNEDTDKYGQGKTFEHHTADQLGGTSHTGIIGSYTGGGYHQDLMESGQQVIDLVTELKQSQWIDQETRAVFLDFTVYNANVNLFCIAKMLFEFLPTGGVMPSWSFHTVKLLRYVSLGDHFILGLEGIFVVFVVYFTIEEIKDALQYHIWFYQHLFWNVIDVIILVLSYIMIGFSIYRFFQVRAILKETTNTQGTYINFEYVGYRTTQLNNAVAICTFFVWIKLFKYISFNKTMRQLKNTLRRCAKDISGFAVMFFIVLCAFAQLGFLLFGSQIYDFCSFGTSVFTLLRTILGDFNYKQIEVANRILGPIFFLSYVFFVFFVLLNMFLAIINDAYAEVKSEVSLGSGPPVESFMVNAFANMIRYVGWGKWMWKGKDHEEADAKDTYKQIRDALKLCNFSDLEIEMFFAKYDIDGNRQINEREKTKILDYLEGRDENPSSRFEIKERPSFRASLRSSIRGSVVSTGEMENLQARIVVLEDAIEGIMGKVNLIVTKLENISEIAKKKKAAEAKGAKGHEDDDKDTDDTEPTD